MPNLSPNYIFSPRFDTERILQVVECYQGYIYNKGKMNYLRFGKFFEWFFKATYQCLEALTQL